MWGEHDFEKIFTTNDVMNIKNGIGKAFGSREIEYHMGVNVYFVPRQNNRPHATPKYGPGKFKFEVDYHRQTYFSTGKVSHIRKTGKIRSISNVFF